ncbi:MAG TPA: hypothetical protein VFE47_26400 [Tepidisphaeraceae bacterium]|jgi:hypothetical protein|nr:hypothetical protein [Tepidisphaeraceae bacterium]
MAMKQEANTPVVLTIGAISCFLILVIMFGTEAWFRYEQRNEMDTLWNENPNTWLIDRRDAQKAHIVAPASEDPKTHARHVPIEVAMEEVIKTGGKAPATQPSAEPATAPAARAE